MSTLRRETLAVSVHAAAELAGAAGAAEIAQLVRRRPRAVLGLATGSSPLPLYAALAQGDADLSEVTAFALDEYIGLPAGHPESYAATIRSQVVEPLSLTPGLVHVPDGAIVDENSAGEPYEAAIVNAGGIDLQILGIGSNGHLGFNEPGSAFTSRTRAVALTDRTRQDNARFFNSLAAVPTRAVTQGLGTIFEARHLLLIAHGPSKAKAVRRALLGPVTEDFPASLLQLHPRVTVVLDDAAAAFL